MIRQADTVTSDRRNSIYYGCEYSPSVGQVCEVSGTEMRDPQLRYDGVREGT